MKILILGGTGMLGHMMFRVLSKHHECYLTARKDFQDLLPIHTFCSQEQYFKLLDVSDDIEIEKIIKHLQPTHIINAIGIIKQLKSCYDKVLTVNINALLPHKLTELSNRYNAKLIHFSTDCVFSGNKGAYTEDDIPDPIDFYGKCKLLGEVESQHHLTLRTSIVGRQLFGQSSLFEWFFSQKGKRVNGFEYAIYSGLTTMAISQVVEKILMQHPDLSGLYHLSSPPISKYDLLIKLNDKLDLGISVDKDTQFKCDRSLSSELFQKTTGIEILDWDAMIDDFCKDYQKYEQWRKK